MAKSDLKKHLVIGSAGQIGTDLVMALRKRYGNDNVIAMGRKTAPSDTVKNSGPWEWGDIVDPPSIVNVIKKYDVDTIYNMAAILSAAGEKNPALAWNVNINGLYNLLEIAREHKIKRVMVPSSIAVFGPETPREKTPQETVLKPRTMYGVSKVAGELLADYYFRKFGVDVRGLRYPGIISSETLPGGGTTDYSVEIFYEAIKKGKYTCFLKEDTYLPMMYMPDCLDATIQLTEADVKTLKHHADFNLSAMSFSPKELAAEIKKYIPELKVDYKPDFRQAIADSWPKSIDDSAARKEWNWKPKYDLKAMVKDMIEKLTPRLKGKK
jgi:nucleoside-diphosphate-sugar epimerase